MVGRDAFCFEACEDAIGDRIPPRGDVVVEVVGGNMTQVCQSRRENDRVIIEYSDQQ